MSPITSSAPIGLDPQRSQERAVSTEGAVHQSPNLTLGSARSSAESITDNMQLSQFAVLLSGLRLLQQTDPAEFRAILSQIGAGLSDAAEGASSEDNAAAAGIISDLNGDFSAAPPNAQIQESQPSVLRGNPPQP